MLTEHYELIKRVNPLAAAIYKDRKYYYQTFNEIALLHGIKVSEVKQLYNKCKWWIKNPDDIWLDGLSERARNALKHHSPYVEFNQLLDDVMNERVDLECLNGVGHKVAVEIRRWCVNHS